MDNRIIIREYLESLKEDQELDSIFPLLLMAKGFEVLATPNNAKGQSQYGKDIVAIGTDEKTNSKYRYYFELKGGSDRHIDDKTYHKDDGIRMSLQEAKDTPFKDVGIPGFDRLPIKYVLVHNGDIKENIRIKFDGFIEQTFPKNNFERWDINWLTKEFDEHLFNEYLIPNQEDSRLFRRVLLLIDTPDYNLLDFKKLVINFLNRMPTPKQERKFKSAWATLLLLGQIVWHKCRQNNNLFPAIDALTFLLLSTWAWILRNKFEEKKQVIKFYRPLVRLHFDFLREYFHKTSRAASLPNGLFAERGGPFEAIGYPLRSFEFLGLLVYYFESSYYFPTFGKVHSLDKNRKKHLEHWHKSYLIKLVEANSGCHRPILDAHSIPILAVVLYFTKSEELSSDDYEFLANYLFNTFDSIFTIKGKAGRFPSLSTRLEPLIEFAATGTRPFNYSDSSSLLIPILMELAAYFDAEFIWKEVLPLMKQDVPNMQTAYPLNKEFDIEQLLFEKHLDGEFYVETGIVFPQTPNEYFKILNSIPVDLTTYRTDKAGFSFLRILAHFYYKTEFFPADWRVSLLKFREKPADPDLQSGVDSSPRYRQIVSGGL